MEFGVSVQDDVEDLVVAEVGRVVEGSILYTIQAVYVAFRIYQGLGYDR